MPQTRRERSNLSCFLRTGVPTCEAKPVGRFA